MSSTTVEATRDPRVSWSAGDDGVARIELGGRGGKPFIFDESSLAELDTCVREISVDRTVRGILLAGTHDTTFCAGADVETIATVTDPTRAEALSAQGQQVFASLEDLPVPVVALVHGTCVGGGLELVLAADACVVSDSKQTRLGLPEVQLGILPAWGGTTRLPEIIGLRAALGMLLSGAPVTGAKAVRLGLAYDCVPREGLEKRGRTLLESLIEAHEHGHHGRIASRRVGATDYLLEEMNWLRGLLLRAARRAVLRRTRGHYPAPMRILDVLGRGLGRPRAERFRLEQEGIASLIVQPVTRNLLSIFLRNRDRERGAPYATAADRDEKRLQHVAVVGGGVMGSGIATALLLKGCDVRLIDPFPEALTRAYRAIERELDSRVTKRRMSTWEKKQVLSRLVLADDYAGLSRAQLVIEAVPEVPAIKHEALERIAAAVAEDTIVATNTSSLSVTGLATWVPTAARFAGLHFFNPAPKMPLVEVVRTPGTSEETLERLIRFSRVIGKTPVVVDDSPAFVVNRLLAPYLLEAHELLVNGADIAVVDRTMRAFGLPMGPFELMDTVGLDVISHVCGYLASIPRMGLSMPAIVAALVKRGDLGQKTGRGFYVHGKRRRPIATRKLLALDPQSVREPSGIRIEPREMRERLLTVIANEANRILDEKVVATADDLDLASIFGMGFPPYTGGIATWAKTRETEA